MAKKHLETDDFKFDDDLEFEDFDFDSSSVEPKDDRSPAVKVAYSALEGFVDEVKDPSLIERTIRQTLPREYGQAYDMADKVLTSTKEEIKKGLKIVQPAARELLSAASRAAPKDSKLQNKLNSINEWLSEYDEYKPSSADTGKIREESINLAIGEIFKTQLEQDSNDKNSKMLEMGVQTQRHRSTIAISSSIERGITSLVQYQEKITANYQRKSLELQLRGYFLQMDTLEQLKKSHAESIAEFKQITKNTALPEFVKIKQSEAFKEAARNKFLGALTGGLFKTGNEMVEGFASNLRQLIGTKAAQLAGAFRQGAAGLDMVSQVSEMMPQDNDGPVLSGAKFGAGILGSSAADLLANKVGLKANELLSKNERVKKIADETGMFLEDAPARIEEFKKSQKGEYGYDQGFVKDTITSGVKILKSLIPSVQNETSLAVNQAQDLLQPGFGSEQINKSVNEIIPGYLSRILQEITIFRTGTQIEPVEYDYLKNKFTDKSSAISSIKESLAPKASRENMQANLDRIINYVDKDRTLTEEQRQKLREALLTSSANIVSSDVENFKKSSTFEKAGLTQNEAETLSELFTRRFSGSADTSQQTTDRAGFSNEYARLRSLLEDPRKNAQTLASLGQTSLLRETGLIDEQNKINISSLISEYLKPVTSTSDYYSKENIRPLSGSDSLRIVNSVPITRWDYKSGFEGGQKDMVGPMAQAVDKATDGQASDGAKINLTALNGYNMSAIQELDKRQRDMLQYMAAQNKLGYRSEEKDCCEQSLETLKDSLATQKEILQKMGSLTINQIGLGSLSGIMPDFKSMKMAPQTASEHLANIFSSLSSVGSKALSSASSTLFSAGRKITRGAGSFVDWVKEPSEFGEKIKSSISSKIDTAYDKLKGYGDLFVIGEQTPRIIAAKMRLGKYYQVMQDGSKKIISNIEDIAGDVYDEMGNIVITKEELKSSFVNKAQEGKNVFVKVSSLLGKSVFDAARSAGSLIPPALRSIGDFGYSVKSKILKTMDYATDVYVRGENTPRLLALVMKNGGYFSVNTKKVIYRPSQIDGPVCDEKLNILISEQDLRSGLVDKWGSDLATPLLRFAKASLGIGLGLAKTSMAAGSRLLGAAGDMLKSVKLPSFGLDKIKNLGLVSFGLDGITITSKKTVDILEDIRDMLRLKFGFEVEKMGPFKPGSISEGLKEKRSASKPLFADTQTSQEQSQEQDSTNQTSSTPTPSSGTGIFGSIASLGVSGLKRAAGLLSKKPGVDGTAASQVKDNTQDASAAAKAPAQAAPTEPAQSEPVDNKSIKESIKEALKQATASIAVSRAQPEGKRKFNDTDGDGLRQGSWRNITSRGAKINAVNKAKAIAPAYENTFDLIARKLGAIKDTISSIVSGAAAMLGGGAITKKVFGALKWATGKGSLGLIKGGAKLGGVGMSAARVLGGLALKGAAGAGALGFTGAAGAAAGLLGTAAAVMTSPVVIGAAALYGSYKLYKYFTKNNIDDTQLYRYMQYGFSKDDKSFVNKVFALEGFLEKNALSFNKDKVATITKVKPKDAKEIMELFGVDVKDENQVLNFQTWFANRFKPIYLTHATELFKISEKANLSNTSSLSERQMARYFSAIRMENGPYDVVTSPTPELDSLQDDKAAIMSYHDEHMKRLKEKADNSPKSKEDKADDVKAAGAIAAASSVAQGANDKKDPGAQVTAQAQPIAQPAQQATQGVSLVDKTLGFFSAAAQSVSKSLGYSVSTLDSIRFRLYGLKEMDRQKVVSLRTMEQHLFKHVKYDGKGAATLELPAAEVLNKFRLEFGISSSSDPRAQSWVNWFNSRFIKVYLQYLTGLRNELGKITYEQTGLSSSGALSIATQIVAQPNWSVDSSPWASYQINMDASSVEEFVSILSANAQKDKLLEQRAQKAKEQAQTNKETGTINRPKATEASTQATGIKEDSVGNSSFADPGKAVSNKVKFAAPGSASSSFANNTEKQPTSDPKALEKIPAANTAGYQAVAPTIREAAKMTGVSEDMMLAVAAVESGFDPNATPRGKGMTSSAKGLYQFLNGTWRDITSKTGSKYGITPETSAFDSRANALMGGEYIKRNVNTIKSVVPNPGPVEAYMAHFLGAGGARSFFRMNPQEIAADKMPDAAKANQPIFFDKGRPRTVGEIYNLMKTKLSRATSKYGLTLNLDSGSGLKAPEQSTNQASTSAMPSEQTPALKNTLSSGNLDSGSGLKASEQSTNQASTSAMPSEQTPALKNTLSSGLKMPVSGVLPNESMSRVQSTVDSATVAPKSNKATQEPEQPKQNFQVVSTSTRPIAKADTASIPTSQSKDYTSSLAAIDSTLTKSLDIQKEILKVIVSIQNKSSTAAPAPASATNAPAAPAAPSQSINRPSKRTPDFPISMSRSASLT